MSRLAQYLDSTTGLGYKIKLSCEMGGFFMVQVSRRDFDGKKIKAHKQTLGKDGFDDDRIIRLIDWQINELQKKFEEYAKKEGTEEA